MRQRALRFWSVFSLIAILLVSALTFAELRRPGASRTPRAFPQKVVPLRVEEALVKPTPGARENDPWQLFDGDLSSAYTSTDLDAQTIAVTLDRARPIVGVRVFGGEGLLSVLAETDGVLRALPGLENLALDPTHEQDAGWHLFHATEALRARVLVLDWRPASLSATLPELEIWSRTRRGDSPLPGRGPGLSAGLPQGVQTIESWPQEQAVGATPATFTVHLGVDPGTVGRAFLLYEVDGLSAISRPLRAINDRPLRGGVVASANALTTTVEIEEISPRWLQRGENRVRFEAAETLTLPDGVTGFLPALARLPGSDYRIRNLRLALLQDDGSPLITDPAWTPAPSREAAALVDGSLRSPWRGTTAELPFRRASLPHTLEFALAEAVQPAAGTLTVEALLQDGGSLETRPPIALDAFGAGWHRLPLSVKQATTGIRLTWHAAAGTPEARPGLREINILASPAATDNDAAGFAPRLLLNPPGELDRGADLRGFLEPATDGLGAAEIFVDGLHVTEALDPSDGALALFLPAPNAPQDKARESWSADLEIVYPGGQRLHRTLHFGPGKSDSDAPRKLRRRVRPGEAARLEHQGARLDLSAEALKREVAITIEGLNGDAMPALDPGMTNVTARQDCFRLGPDGQRFERPIRLTLPFDPDKIPTGMTPADVRTFYFDTEAGRWIAIEREAVNLGETTIESWTDHFTDFVNATLTVPDHPEGSQFSPNSIGQLETADPAAGITLIEPPGASPSGSADLTFPLIVPPGRGGMAPHLALTYNSDSGNGWLGMGWDLATSHITVDTLFGVPRYSLERESEVYTLDGAFLAPASPGTSEARLPERPFVRRAEGTFQRIIRHGDQPDNYWWEVTNQDGTRFQYGAHAGARVADPIREGNIFQWNLSQIIDAHGNTVTYTYQRDNGNNGEAWTQLYPLEITYTGTLGTDSASAYYRVAFELDDGTRPDQLSSGLPGFKTFSRFRLDKVTVYAGNEPVRSYRLRYRVGDFAKSLLESVALEGETGEELVRHTFRYFTMPTRQDGYDGFSSQASWGAVGQGSDATESTQFSGGGHAFVGLGDSSCSNHAGLQAGFNLGFTDTTVSFLDVNGDGLPDRIASNGAVELNQLNRQGTPESWRGSFQSTSFGGTAFLGHGDEQSFDFNGGLHLAQDAAVVSGGVVWSESFEDRAILDADGDGRPDLVSTQAGFQVHRNTGGGFTAPDLWAGYTLDGVNLEMPGQREEVLENFVKSNPLRQLLLPFTGTVTLRGAVTKFQATGADGVKVSLHHNDSKIWQRQIAATDTAPCIPAPGNACGDGLTLSVKAGDNLYFLADSVEETAGDALLWSPVVRYTGRTAEESARREPFGPKVFTFDGQEDFRLDASQVGGWVANAQGTVQIFGPLTKLTTADDVVAEVRKNGIAVYRRTLAADEAVTLDAVPALSVTTEDALSFHLTADSPFDPDRVRWTPTVRYAGGQLCLPGSQGSPVCGTLRCDEGFEDLGDTQGAGSRAPCVLEGALSRPVPMAQETMEQAVQVAYATPRLFGDNQPTELWEAPETGRFTIEVNWSRGVSPPDPVILYVQGLHRLYAKRQVPTGETELTFQVKVDLTAGDPLYVTVVAENPLQTGRLSAVVDEDEELPVNRRLRSAPLGQRVSLLAGGHHGWYYGDWNGDKAFREDRLYRDDSEDFTVALPRWQGIDTVAEPVWTASGFDLYFAANSLKPSRRGADVVSQLRRSTGGGGGGPSLLRKTTGRTGGFSLGAGVGIALSSGSADTLIDLLDMNGDRYPDQVSGGQVRFSNGRDGFGSGESLPGMANTVQEISDANFSLSLSTVGLGTAFAKRTGSGKAQAVASTMPTLASTASISQARQQLVDVNGDGLPDRVELQPGGTTMDVYLNLGYRFGGKEQWPLPQWSTDLQDTCREPTNFLNEEIVGLITDLDTPDTLSWTKSAGLNVGAAFGIFGAGVGTTLSREIVTLRDVNGDGLADHLYKDDGEGFFRVKLNRGNHWGPEEKWYADPWSTSLGDGYDPGLFSCFDALSMTGNVSGNGSVGVPLCIPLIPPVVVAGLRIELSAQLAGGNGGLQLFFEDLDGDGLPDHALKKAGDPTVYVRRNQASRVNLLTAVERPLGGSFTLDYTRQGNRIDTSDPDHRIDLPSNQWALSEVILEDGRGNAYRTTFDYFNDGFLDRQERVPYGYARVLTTRPDGSTIDSHFHNQDFYRRYLPTKTIHRDETGRIFTVETRDYAEPPSNPPANSFFAALLWETTDFYEGQSTQEGGAHKTWTRTFQYDTFGNVVRYEDLGDAADPDDDLAGAITYHIDPGNYIIKPATMTVRDGNGRLLRQRSGSYDTRGNLLRLEQTLTGGRDPETGSPYTSGDRAIWTMTWAGDGSLTSVTDPVGFQRAYQYDPETGTYITAVRDTFGYASGMTYNLKYGVPEETTDKNGNRIRQVYDAFGRQIAVFAPQDLGGTGGGTPSLAMEYFPAASPPYAVVHHKDITRSDPIDTVVFQDGLKRTLQVRQDTEIDSTGGTGSGTATRIGMQVSGQVEFDPLGRIAAVGQPVFDPNASTRFLEGPLHNPTRFEYDILDRRTRVRFPFQAETRIAYDLGTLDSIARLRIRRTDPEGHTTTTYRSLRGDVVGVEQSNTVRGARRTLVTRYAYNPISELEQVTDAAGNITTVEYDTLGRRTVVDNPDLGPIEFRFDRAGNLGARITAELAAAGQQIRLHRTFNRLERIAYPSTSDVLFTYGRPGASFHRADRVVTVTNEAGVEERFYGPLGETVKRVRTANALNGNSPKGPYTTTFAYDSFHRLLGVTYPDGEELTYTFDAGGRVQTATGEQHGERYPYVTHKGYDAFGDPVRVVFGNGVETRQSYDPLSRFLTVMASVAPQGREFQDLRLAHDKTGVVLSLRNDVPLPKPSEFGGPAEQTFHYDEIYQLVAAEGSYRFPPNKRSDYRLTMSYDETGNILSKRQVHEIVQPGGSAIEQQKTSYDWSYDYTGAQPHAVTHLGERTFQYDRNGNQLGWDSDSNGTRRRMTWDEENRLKAVADNGQTTRFLYDARGTRTNKAGPHGETIYVNPYFSVRNGNITSKHIWLDRQRIVTKLGQPALGNPLRSAPIAASKKPEKPGKPQPGPDANPVEDKRYFFHPDHLGSTHFVTDADGELYQHLEYFPFGEIWVDERAESERTPYLFSAKELDDETALAYFEARYYDPRQSQWVSVDPILEHLLKPDALARPDLSPKPFRLPGYTFAYVGNDPINLVDPTGLGKKAKTTAKTGLAKAKAQLSAPTKKIVKPPTAKKAKVTVTIDSARFPESAQHIDEAQSNGHPTVLTIDRSGAKKRRRESLRGIKTVKGKDRDEYPPAMFAEGGQRTSTARASVKLIDPKDNRGSGSFFGAQLRSQPDGTTVQFVTK